MSARGAPTALTIALTAAAIAATVATVAATVAGPPEGGIQPRKEVIKKTCQYDRDCARHAYCKLQNECSCKEGFFIYKEDLAKSEVCLKRVMGVGDDCVEAAQCQLALGPSAECRSTWDGAVCRCVPWAHEVDGRCYNTSKVGEHCLTKNNCLIEGGPTLTCAGSVCVCPRLQHGSSDGTRCLDDRHLGNDCLEDDECISTNSHCVGICECRVQFVTNARNRRCLRAADHVGDMCEEDIQCSRFMADAECSRNNECVCRDGFHPGPQGVICWRSSALGEACSDDRECLARPLPLAVPYNETRAACVNNLCRCAAGFHADEDGRHCLEGSGARHALASLALVLIATAITAVSAGV